MPNINRINQLIDIYQIQFEEGVMKKIDVDQLRVYKTNLSTEIQNNLFKMQSNLIHSVLSIAGEKKNVYRFQSSCLQ